MTSEQQLYVIGKERQRLHSISKSLWNCRDRIEDDKIDHSPIRNDEINAITPLINAGYKLIGWGIGRIVLRMPAQGGLNGFVVKLGRYGNDLNSIGMSQIREEVRLWLKHHDKQIPLLPPLDWQKGTMRWIVMPYGTPLDSNDIDTLPVDNLISTSIEELSSINTLDSIEFIPQNFVLYQGEAYLADYGRPNIQ